MYRVSNVEAFRKWERDEDADTDRLIDDILGRSVPSAAMEAGSCFHRLLEAAPVGQSSDRIEWEGRVFTFDGDFQLPVCPIRELRASRSYMVDGEPIVISGQVDAVEGVRVDDHKTTARFDPERYLTGYQWRLYLEIFGADVFRWNVFEWDETPAGYEVFALHTLQQYRYPGMGQDCLALVERFAHFVRRYVEVLA